jgi:hypothetical protein
MKKFVLNISILLTPVLLLGYGLDKLISDHLRKSNLFAQKEYPTWNTILDGQLNAELLIYGSSRAWVQFDPRIIEDNLHQSVFNLGIDGYPFHIQHLRHLLALKNNPKPKTIIHAVDIGTLIKSNWYNTDQFLPYMLWDKTFYDYTSSYEGFSYLDYIIPLVRYRGRMDIIKTASEMIFWPKNNPTQRVKGYQGQHTLWNSDFDNAKKTMKRYTAKPDPFTLKLFDNYLETCKKQNINVILVYAPYHIDGQAFIENPQEMIDQYKAFAKKYGFLFLDFTQDPICYDRKYFYNTSHMNITGAELFTKKLCDKIKALDPPK